MKQTFKDYKSLSREIDKRDYENIEGLKAEITEKEFNHFLNVLPPINWINEYPNNSFILSECLTENLYYKFSQVEINKKIKFFCEVVRYKRSREELFY
jgi:hypothetical protein